ncbi:MAG: hypothetical protein IJ622_06645 [Bacteroidales bacterium]|nr:hypothetical protein [Bacteroidales bacterium]
MKFGIWARTSSSNLFPRHCKCLPLAGRNHNQAANKEKASATQGKTMRKAHKVSKNKKHKKPRIMNTKKILGAVLLIAIFTVMMYACTKEKDAQTNSMEPSHVVLLSDLPVYYNGRLESAFSEIDYMPTRSADMELTSIVDTSGIYYFDQDSLFTNSVGRIRWKSSIRTIQN